MHVNCPNCGGCGQFPLGMGRFAECQVCHGEGTVEKPDPPAAAPVLRRPCEDLAFAADTALQRVAVLGLDDVPEFQALQTALEKWQDLPPSKIT